MLIVCPSCATSYDIEAEKLAGGRTVRCARCRTVWHAAPSELASLLTAIGGAAAGAAATPTHAETTKFSPATGASGETLDNALVAAGAAYGHDHASADAAPAADAPSLVPAPYGVMAADADDVTTAEPAEDIESVAARGARIAREPPPRRGRPSLLPVAILLLTAAIGSIISWRSQIVAVAPQSAPLYAAVGLPVNLRGLVFEGVKTSEQTHEGVPVLLVEGNIVNVVKTSVPVPRLRFAVRNPAGLEVYAWTARADQSVLGPGEVLPFRSRLATPPADANDVMVRFFHRRDLNARRTDAAGERAD
ncbi:MAG TPA: zinc-ribbon domain-containing protein [Burkholderiales bacterium]|nr:zinc-ribbon domain-containing protein [Burkholderiales bacterium]